MFSLKSPGCRFFLLCLLTLLAFSACTSTPPAQATAAPARNQPDWVRDPYTRFNSATEVAAVGTGSSRDVADRTALAALVAVFGQSIQVAESISVSYQEAVRSGVTASWSESTTAQTSIATAAGMDTLVGAEIGDRWDNGSEFFAVAVLNKTRAASTYSEMIRANQTMITNLTTIPDTEKFTLDGFARFQFAATIADITATYVNLLSAIGAPALAQGVTRGDDLRLEAQNITRAIPVGIRVANDRQNRIQGAFARALSGLGFQSGGTASRYVLDVTVNISPVTLAGNQNLFARIEVTANLTDTATNNVVLPFNFNTREGHTSQTEADNRAVAAAERRINDEYARLLNNHLTTLLPTR